jgi:hypothetical protein
MAVCVFYILCIQPPTLQPLPTTMILLELGGVASPCLGGWGQPNCHPGVPPHILGSNWVLQPPGTRGTGGSARMVGCTWALAHTPHPHPTPQPPHLHHWLWGLPSWLQHTQCNPNPHPGLQGQGEWGLGGVAAPWLVRAARTNPQPPTPPPTPLALGPALLAAAYSVQSQPPPRFAGPGGVGAGWGGCTLARTRRADQPPAPNPPTYTTGSGACPPGCSILSAIPTPTQVCRARGSGGWGFDWGGAAARARGPRRSTGAVAQAGRPRGRGPCNSLLQASLTSLCGWMG